MNEMIGKKYGLLTIEKPYNGSNKRFVCKCECGNIRIAYVSQLETGIKSCGCLSKKMFTGNSKTRLYGIWANMKKRCYIKTNPCYKHYGGRGIKMCDEWIGENGFDSFREWSMNHGYSDELTIDRIDVNGNYEPSNCRWITWKEQHDNTRRTVRIEVDGVTKTALEWSLVYGVNPKNITRRIREGIDPKIAVTVKNTRYYTLEKKRQQWNDENRK